MKGKKKRLKKGVVLLMAFVLALGMLPLMPGNILKVQAAENTAVTYKAISGTAGVSDTQNFDKLFDGKDYRGGYTKWCVSFSGSAYIIFKASEIPM